MRSWPEALQDSFPRGCAPDAETAGTASAARGCLSGPASAPCPDQPCPNQRSGPAFRIARPPTAARSRPGPAFHRPGSGAVLADDGRAALIAADEAAQLRPGPAIAGEPALAGADPGIGRHPSMRPGNSPAAGPRSRSSLRLPGSRRRQGFPHRRDRRRSGAATRTWPAPSPCAQPPRRARRPPGTAAPGDAAAPRRRPALPAAGASAGSCPAAIRPIS